MMRRLLFAICMLVALDVSAQYGQYVGGDISLLPAYEASKTAYLDGDGNKIDDLIQWLTKDCGWNSFRVRLFVNPDNKNHDGVIQDLDYVKALGRRIKDAGAQFMLDFHYSDSWADPTKQFLPAAWNDCTTAEQKAAKVYEYTKECLSALVAAGATPDLVQVGNEISYGIVGIKVHPYDYDGDDWNGYVTVLQNGCKGVREVCPKAKIVLHTERSGKLDQTAYYYNKVKDVDYDIIGLSYYPIWHGYLKDLKQNLDNLATAFPTKEVQIVETAYNFQYWPTSGVTYNAQTLWSCSPEGQFKFMKDLIVTLAQCPNVNGLFYWFPEEAGSGDAANWNTYEGVVIGGWLNRGLWYSNADGNKKAHYPLKTAEGMVQTLMRTFLSPEAAAVETAIADEQTQSKCIVNIAGQTVGPSYRGLIIKNGKKYLIK